MKFDDAKIDRLVEVGGPTNAPKMVPFSSSQANVNAKEDACLNVYFDPLFDHPRFLASLIRVPRWATESWTLDKKRGGWLNWSHGSFRVFVSLAQLEALIGARIRELGQRLRSPADRRVVATARVRT